MLDSQYAEILFQTLLHDLMPPRVVWAAGETPKQAVDAMVAQFPWLPVADIQAHVEGIFARRERF